MTTTIHTAETRPIDPAVYAVQTGRCVDAVRAEQVTHPFTRPERQLAARIRQQHRRTHAFIVGMACGAVALIAGWAAYAVMAWWKGGGL